jgi:hypothetical protein
MEKRKALRLKALIKKPLGKGFEIRLESYSWHYSLLILRFTVHRYILRSLILEDFFKRFRA